MILLNVKSVFGIRYSAQKFTARRSDRGKTVHLLMMLNVEYSYDINKWHKLKSTFTTQILSSNREIVKIRMKQKRHTMPCFENWIVNTHKKMNYLLSGIIFEWNKKCARKRQSPSLHWKLYERVVKIISIVIISKRDQFTCSGRHSVKITIIIIAKRCRSA